jgi:5-methylcytosine-specific restriction endonuclease McrA
MIHLIEDVSNLSNNELLSYSVKLSRHEDDIGLRLIACLREAEKRMLYIEVNLGSLWEYATQYLCLSKGNAQMKIDAMRLARDNPIAQEKIQTGELTIPNAAKVNSFLRQEQKAGKPYDSEAKKEVIESVLNLSQSKCELALLARSPNAIPTEKIRQLTETQTEIRMVVDNKTMTLLGRLKELLSHKMPGAAYADLLDYLAREKVEALERKRMGATMEELEKQSLELTPDTGVESAPQSSIDLNSYGAQVTSHAEVKPLNKMRVNPRKYIPIADQRWVMRRAKGQCEGIRKDGSRCTGRWKLETDHVVALANGGTNHRSNLRATCRNCNLYYAKKNIGSAIMRKYVSSFR